MNNARIENGGLVTPNIKIEGDSIPDDYQVVSIFVEKQVNHVSSAKIVLHDGSAAAETFPLSESKTFVPGNKISIEAGYDGKNRTIFSGLVTKQRLRIDQENGSMLEVECKDEAVRMTIGRKSMSFYNNTDGQVIKSLINNHGLEAEVENTETTSTLLQQYYATDWDFMLTRAKVNGLLVKAVNGKVSVFSPVKNTKPVLTITHGVNLYQFNAELNALTQYKGVKASAWDHKTQSVITEQVSESISGPGNLSSNKLSEVIGLSEFQLQTSAALDNENLTSWAKAQSLQSALSKIVGDVEFLGNSRVEPGNYIELKGMGKRFNGGHLVSSVVHDIRDGNWFTRTQIGLPLDGFIDETDVTAPSTSELLPGIHGLHNATVKKINDDPDNEFRILIDLPLFDPEGEGLWARLSNFYSTSGAGAFFLPEIGDEVIVGFLNNDPRFPIILGSLYSGAIKPHSELSANENNSHKAIISKSHLGVIFDDENKIMTVMTPGDNRIVLDDNKKQVTIRDQNENAIVMSGDGITIKSPKNISIQADQDIDIEGTRGINATARSGDVEISAINIKESAKAQYSAKASASASIQSAGTLNLKGAIVNIN